MIESNDSREREFDWQDAKRRLEATRRSIVDADSVSPEDTAALLAARASALARPPEQTIDSEDILEVVCFSLGPEEYAITADAVLELRRPSEITPIPQTESHVVGVTNLHGEVTAIIDLRRLLGISGEAQTNPQVLVLGNEAPEFAIVVDGIRHIHQIHRSDLVEPMGSRGSHRDLIIGCDKEGLVVLSGSALLSSEEFFIEQID